jgi:hypothetical protein
MQAGPASPCEVRASVIAGVFATGTGAGPGAPNALHATTRPFGKFP